MDQTKRSEQDRKKAEKQRREYRPDPYAVWQRRNYPDQAVVIGETLTREAR